MDIGIEVRRLLVRSNDPDALAIQKTSEERLVFGSLIAMRETGAKLREYDEGDVDFGRAAQDRDSPLLGAAIIGVAIRVDS